MKDFIHRYYPGFFIFFLVLIIGLSFYIGYEQGKGVTSTQGIVFSCPTTVLDTQKISPQVLGVQSSLVDTADTSPATATGGAYLGSKNGTKYYTPGCPGTKRIKPENYIWFQSVEDATLQGYSKGSC